MCPARAPLLRLTRADLANLLAVLEPAKQADLFRAAGLRVNPRRAGDRAADLVLSRLRSLDHAAAHNAGTACADALRVVLTDFAWDCDDDEVVPQIERLMPQLRARWSPAVLRVLFAVAADIGAIDWNDHTAILALVDETEPAGSAEPANASTGPELAADSRPIRRDVAASSETGPEREVSSALDELVLGAIRRNGPAPAATAVDELVTLDATRPGSWYVAGFASGWLGTPATARPPTQALADEELRGTLAALAERGDSTAVAATVSRTTAAVERILSTPAGAAVAAGVLDAVLDADRSRAARLLRVVPEAFPGHGGVLGHAGRAAARLLRDGDIATAEHLLATCDDTLTLWATAPVDDVTYRALEATAAALAVRRASCRRRRSDFVGATGLLDRIPAGLLDATGAARVAEERALIAAEISDPAALPFPRTEAERPRLEARLARAETLVDDALAAAASRAVPHLLAGVLAVCRHDDRNAATELSLALAAPAWPDDTVTRIGFHAALARLRLLEPGTDEAASARVLDALAAGYRPGRDDLVDAVHALEAHGSPRAVEVAVAAFEASPRAPEAVDVLVGAAREGGAAAVTAAAAVADDERLSLADRFELLAAAADGACTTGDRSSCDAAVDGVERVLTRACDPNLDLRWGVSLGTPALRDAVGPAHADALRVELLRRAGALDEAAAVARSLFFRAVADGQPALDPRDLLEVLGILGVGGEELASLARLAPAERGRATGTDRPASADADADAIGRPVRVLFVGGNEVQARYHEVIDARVGAHYDGQVTVEWFAPGWSPNWSREADRIEAAYGTSDALVLMSFVRTLLGRRLRRSAGEAGLPWVACTGHGRDSLERAVERAVAVITSERCMSHPRLTMMSFGGPPPTRGLRCPPRQSVPRTYTEEGRR